MEVSEHRLIQFVLVALAGVLLIIAFYSLHWGLAMDTPIMAYLAYAMDHHERIPYRDFFEINMPGTYFVNLVIGRFLGYSDLAFRWGDLIYLIAILAATIWWMRSFGWRVACCAALFFGLFYLGFGPNASLEREYLALLPIAATLILLTTPARWLSDNLRSGAVGLCLGLAATIKPHLAVAWPLLLAWQLWEIKHRDGPWALRRLLTLGLLMMVGALIPLAVVAFYLQRHGALLSFFDIAANYWPLYNRLTGNFATIQGLERFHYLLRWFREFGGMGIWLAPAVLGAFLALYRTDLTPTQQRRVALLVGLAICYAVYPVIAGKFFNYHYLLFVYFAIILSSLCLLPQRRTAIRPERFFPVMVLGVIAAAGIHPPPGFLGWIEGQGIDNQRDRKAEEIAAYLIPRLQPGDTVQPLDLTEGSAHAMLLSRARLATPFLIDFQFYHHVSNPYIQGLRRRFIADLQTAKPRFIIQMTHRNFAVSGPDTSPDFPELQGTLDSSYALACRGEGYCIYHRTE